MQIITGEVNKNLIVNEDVLLSGTCNGNIYIEKDGTLALEGTCNGVIIVKDLGVATIHGTVNGYIFNLGGELFVYENAIILGGAYHIYGVSQGNVTYLSEEPPSDDEFSE